MSQIKIIALMNNKVLVSEIEEVGAEVGEPAVSYTHLRAHETR